MPNTAETSQGGKVTVLCNQKLQTDRTNPNNKPDIIIRDNEKGTCMWQQRWAKCVAAEGNSVEEN